MVIDNKKLLKHQNLEKQSFSGPENLKIFLESEDFRGLKISKEIFKNKLKIFYKKLSLIRKKGKPSKSMNWTVSASEREFDKIINTINMHNLNIADIGGANGEFIFKLASNGKFNDNSNIMLIDISPYYLSKAKKEYSKNFRGKFKFNTMCLDVEDLKLKNRFDIVFFRSILEHIYFPDTVVENIRKSLKDEGLLFISTPNKNRLNELLKKLMPLKSTERLKLKIGTDVPEVIFLEKKMGLKEHIQEYSLGEIKRLMKKHNFIILKKGYSPIPFIIPSFCDKHPIIFHIQKIFIILAGFLKLNRFFGFEYMVLAQKQK